MLALLEKDPQNRPASATALIEAIDQLGFSILPARGQPGAPVSSPREESVTTRSARAWMRPLSVLGAIAMVAVAIGIAAGRDSEHASDERAHARAASAVATPKEQLIDSTGQDATRGPVAASAEDNSKVNGADPSAPKTAGPPINPKTTPSPNDPRTAAGARLDPKTGPRPTDPKTAAGTGVDPKASTGVASDPKTTAGAHVDPRTRAGSSNDPKIAAGTVVDPKAGATAHLDPKRAPTALADGAPKSLDGSADPKKSAPAKTTNPPPSASSKTTNPPPSAPTAEPDFGALDAELGRALADRSLVWTDLAAAAPEPARRWARWYKKTEEPSAHDLATTYDSLMKAIDAARRAKPAPTKGPTAAAAHDQEDGEAPSHEDEAPSDDSDGN